jgi:hypothetical protein
VSAAGSASAPPVAAAPPGARRWRYRGFVEANPGSSGVVKTTVDLVLVEVTRREIEPGLVLGELVAEIGGALATRERLQEAGLESAPFSSFPLRWGLLRDARGKAPRVWLLEGEIPASGATLSRAQKETATFDFNRSVGPFEALPRMPADRAVAYTRQVGVWKSRCEGFEHPAPDPAAFLLGVGHLPLRAGDAPLSGAPRNPGPRGPIPSRARARRALSCSPRRRSPGPAQIPWCSGEDQRTSILFRFCPWSFSCQRTISVALWRV